MCKNKNNAIQAIINKNYFEKHKKIKKEKKTIFDRLKSKQNLYKKKKFLDLKKYFLNFKEKDICCKVKGKKETKKKGKFDFFLKSGKDLELEKNQKEAVLDFDLYKKKEDFEKNLNNNKNPFIYSENTKTTLNSENEILTKNSIFKNNKKKKIFKKINSIQNLFSTQKRVNPNFKKNNYKNKFFQYLIKNRKNQNQTKIHFQNSKKILNPDNSLIKDDQLKIHYTLKNKIGEGAFSIVTKAINNHSKEEVAIKTIDNNKLKKKNIFHIIKNEIKILKKLNNKHIIKLKDIVQNKNYTHLIFNLIQGSTLTKFLSSQKNKKLTETKAIRIFKKILQGVNYLHSQNIYHRDLKLDNIMVASSLQNSEIEEIFIIDFGFAILNKSNGYIDSICGTPRYMAPEIFDKKYRGSCVDVWALGVIFYRLLTGVFPFKKKGGYQVYEVGGFGDRVNKVFKNVFCVREEERCDLDFLIKLLS